MAERHLGKMEVEGSIPSLGLRGAAQANFFACAGESKAGALREPQGRRTPRGGVAKKFSEENFIRDRFPPSAHGATLAQLVEQFLRKKKVPGSNPGGGLTQKIPRNKMSSTLQKRLFSAILR